jgi:hypothetical protein
LLTTCKISRRRDSKSTGSSFSSILQHKECAVCLEKKGFAETIASVTNASLPAVLPLLTLNELKEMAKLVGVKLNKQTNKREDLIQWLLQVK